MIFSGRMNGLGAILELGAILDTRASLVKLCWVFHKKVKKLSVVPVWLELWAIDTLYLFCCCPIHPYGPLPYSRLVHRWHLLMQDSAVITSGSIWIPATLYLYRMNHLNTGIKPDCLHCNLACYPLLSFVPPTTRLPFSVLWTCFPATFLFRP